MIIGIIISIVFILSTSSSINGILGEHEYTIGKEGLYEKTFVNETANKWEGIMKIKITKSYFIFQISSYLFHIIPIKNFKTKKEFDKFSSTSIDYWKNIHNSPLERNI